MSGSSTRAAATISAISASGSATGASRSGHRAGSPSARSAGLSELRNGLSAAATTPVLLTGDFNAPSHLDWTAANSRCGYGAVQWPSSTAPANAGLTDSYRQAHPDPATSPGNTWSPVDKTFAGGYGYDAHTGEPEPQDRIDFVHYKGPLTVLSSDAVSTDLGTWPSDHAAVLTVFQVN
ncbi:endonuclease/exonuclease/phosphatase family protein [Dactylosporangium salmoneum]|uniref:Endonuclease/exonuclease/phosphatase domain-containing protein n=1 Tax=Dactylosporangium salmoneum TaxID=53361 RepID=A0ABP5TBL8_9ACTN